MHVWTCKDIPVQVNVRIRVQVTRLCSSTSVCACLSTAYTKLTSLLFKKNSQTSYGVMHGQVEDGKFLMWGPPNIPARVFLLRSWQRQNFLKIGEVKHFSFCRARTLALPSIIFVEP